MDLCYHNRLRDQSSFFIKCAFVCMYRISQLYFVKKCNLSRMFESRATCRYNLTFLILVSIFLYIYIYVYLICIYIYSFYIINSYIHSFFYICVYLNDIWWSFNSDNLQMSLANVTINFVNFCFFLLKSQLNNTNKGNNTRIQLTNLTHENCTTVGLIDIDLIKKQLNDLYM